MVSSLLALSAVALMVSLLGLLAFGNRWNRARFDLTLFYGILVLIPVYAAGDLGWRLPRSHIVASLVLIYVAIVASALSKRVWNPAGQAFFGTLVLTCVTFVVMVVAFSFALDRSLLARGAEAVLLVLELFAFTLLIVTTHEALDTVCRVHWARRSKGIDRGDYAPFVSVHVATHNEPPELVLQTLKALRKLDYPNYEVIVLDNNTVDPALWRPVEEFCRNDSILRFVHLENWPGFKSGALNHGLEICDPRTAIIAVVDADFIVKPHYLDRTVGYFKDPSVGFVQTAQGFRSDVDTGFFHRLGLVYQLFDFVSLPNRNERDAIIFCGTMGLIRKKALEEAGAWGEWCVTEDAELSIRLLARGYRSQYVETVFGRGVMPLTFSAMKSQRFRWCFGGIQILREHWKLMFTGSAVDRDGTRLQLTRGQRYDYLVAAFGWFQAPLAVVFSGLLLIAAIAQLLGLGIALRPLVGFFVAIPLLLLSTGLLRGVWAFRSVLRGTYRDALGAFGILLSLNWAVALGVLQGLMRREGVFLRTPKFKENDRLVQALKSTRVETPFALAMAGAAGAALASGLTPGNLFIAVLAGWGSLMFFTAPVTAFIASRAHLDSAVMRRRRSLESESARKPIYKRPVGYAFAGAVASLLLLMVGGSLTVGPPQNDLGEVFTLPDRKAPGSEGGTRRAVKRRDPSGAAPSSEADTSASTADRLGNVTTSSNGGARTGATRTDGIRAQDPTGPASPAPTTAASQPTPAPAPQATVPDSEPSPAPARTPAPRPTSQPAPRDRPTTQPTGGP